MGNSKHENDCLLKAQSSRFKGKAVALSFELSAFSIERFDIRISDSIATRLKGVS
jgi:hypothetical protein